MNRWPVAGTRAFTRTINSSWDNWENAPAASDYATEMDKDAVLFTSDAYGQGTVIKKYFLPESSDVFAPNVWMGNFIFYVSGTKSFKFTNPGDGANHMIFYVLPDANLTFTENFNLQKPSDFKMYIAEGARVTFDNGWALVRASNTGPNLTLRFEATDNHTVLTDEFFLLLFLHKVSQKPKHYCLTVHTNLYKDNLIHIF